MQAAAVAIAIPTAIEAVGEVAIEAVGEIGDIAKQNVELIYEKPDVAVKLASKTANYLNPFGFLRGMFSSMQNGIIISIILVMLILCFALLLSGNYKMGTFFGAMAVTFSGVHLLVNKKTHEEKVKDTKLQILKKEIDR